MQSKYHASTQLGGHLNRSGLIRWLFSILLLLSSWSVHSAAVVSDPASFDHLSAGFALDGKHAQLSCEACHTGGLFDALPAQCNDCHDGTFALGQAPGHIPTTSPCDACHTSESFSITSAAQVDHSTLGAMACIGCHNGATALGKANSHVSTTDNCAACHTTSRWVPVVVVDHNEVLGSCIACHNGERATGKPIHHPMSTDQCQRCHTSLAWLPLMRPFAHEETSAPCANCHDGVIAMGQDEDHFQTAEACDTCHQSTMSWLDVLFDHGPFSGQACTSSGCHNSSGGATYKPTLHPITSENCEACHSVYAWLPLNRPFPHDESVDSCVASGCHALGSPGGAQPAGHPATTKLCDACHTLQQWLPLIRPFPHNHALDTCVASGCHAEGGEGGSKPAIHPRTTEICEACHTETSWLPVTLPFDHAQAIDTCAASACHGSTSPGSKKSLTHPLTTDVCDACHTDLSWLPVILPFDHSQALASCGAAGCHAVDAGTGSQKPPTHPVTTELCDACHSQSAFLPLLTPIDHSQTTDQCATCHNGTIAIGQGPNHVQTASPCDACHTTTITWQGAGLVDHSLETAACGRSGCHDGLSDATGQPATHPNTTNRCESCHAYPAWLPWIIVDHAEVNGSCLSCHNLPGGHIDTSSRCELCHSTDIWRPVITVDHGEVNGTCVSCHVRPLGHVDTSDVCEACHSTNVWIPVTVVDHDQVFGTCASCHNLPGGHCLVVDDCHVCHSVTSWRNPAACSTGGTNRPPVAVINGPGGGAVNALLNFDALSSFDPDSDPLTYIWDMGDGTRLNGPTINHSYAATGTFVVNLTVDDGNAIDTTSVIVTISVSGGGNNPPTAIINGPASAGIGETLFFDGLSSSDLDNDPLIYNWDMGDGAQYSGGTVSHSYVTAGTYVVTLTVSDGVVADLTTVIITVSGAGGGANNPPTAVINGPTTGARNTPLSFDGLGSSDLDGDPLTYRWDMGDGTVLTGASVTHTYTGMGMGNFTITLVVNDGSVDSLPATHALRLMGM